MLECENMKKWGTFFEKIIWEKFAILIHEGKTHFFFVISSHTNIHRLYVRLVLLYFLGIADFAENPCKIVANLTFFSMPDSYEKYAKLCQNCKNNVQNSILNLIVSKMQNKTKSY